MSDAAEVAARTAAENAEYVFGIEQVEDGPLLADGVHEQINQMVERLREAYNPHDELIVAAIAERVERVTTDEEALRVFRGIAAVYADGIDTVAAIRALFGKKTAKTMYQALEQDMADQIRDLV